jgi:hypothetical protein
VQPLKLARERGNVGRTSQASYIFTLYQEGSCREAVTFGIFCLRIEPRVLVPRSHKRWSKEGSLIASAQVERTARVPQTHVFRTPKLASLCVEESVISQ